MNEALDKLGDRFNRLVREGKIEEMDEMLSTIYTDNISVIIMIGVLVATLPIKSKLKERPAFFYRVKKEIEIRGNFEDQLLNGLE